MFISYCDSSHSARMLREVWLGLGFRVLGAFTRKVLFVHEKRFVRTNMNLKQSHK